MECERDPMTKRPLIISVIAGVYLLSPVLILVQAALMNRIPLIGFNSVFANLLPPDIAVLCLYLLCAVAIFRVKKWGWYVFILSSACLIGYNAAAIFLNPAYNVFLLILYNTALTAVAFVFFRKNVIAPYFNPDLRWWETERRYMLDIRMDIYLESGPVSAGIMDISGTGCFILPATVLEVGRTYEGLLRFLGNFVSLGFRVVRKSRMAREKEGYGLQFVDTGRLFHAGMRKVLARLERSDARNRIRDGGAATASRYNVMIDLTVSGSQHEIHGDLLNLSRQGCLILSESELAPVVPYDVKLVCLNRSVSLKGVIRWKTGESHKKAYGFHFSGMDRDVKKNLEGIITSLRKMGVPDRLKVAGNAPEQIPDSKVAHTPYRLILALKKMILGRR
jgi:hypothetical protein